MKTINKQKIIFSLLLCFVFVFVAININSVDVNATDDEPIFLHVNSPLLMSNDKIFSLDSNNPDVAAIIYNDRTLVPLRAISEHLNAKVSYDNKTKTAKVEYNNAVFSFVADESEYSVTKNGKTVKHKMDTKAIVLESRMMLPLRLLSEDLLGKQVAYKNDVISIQKKKSELDDKTVSNVKTRIGKVTKATSEEEILNVMKSLGDGHMIYVSDTIPEELGDIAKSVPVPSADAKEESTPARDSFSETNIQVAGVDEADIAKTDGKYIYYASIKAVRIVAANDGDMKEVATVNVGENKIIHEIFVDKDRLIIIGMADNYHLARISHARIPYRVTSFIETYDVSEIENPKLFKSHEIKGMYLSSRKVGDYVYMVSNSFENALPEYRAEDDDQFIKTEPGDVLIMRCPFQPGFLTVSSINIRDNEPAKLESITTSGGTIYMNDKSLYITQTNWSGYGTEETEIVKFNIKGLNVGYAGSTKVPGMIENQFNMDEYEGNLRIATTSQKKNMLYVLDSSLSEIGKIDGFAPGENMYSVRFMGDTAYIVTFLRIDPLFIIDLKDPKEPKIVGQLEIPGFSDYLHPVGKGKLLGIGYDTKQKGDVTRTNGIKLSLFDVTDMNNPKELSNLILGDENSYASAMYDHKEIMVDLNKNLVGFHAAISNKNGALLVDFNNDKLNKKALIEYKIPQKYAETTPTGTRLMYIGNTLYYLQDGIIRAFDYDTLKEKGELVLV